MAVSQGLDVGGAVGSALSVIPGVSQVTDAAGNVVSGIGDIASGVGTFFTKATDILKDLFDPLWWARWGTAALGLLLLIYPIREGIRKS